LGRDVEGKVHPITCHEGTVGDRGIALLFFLLTLVLDDVGCLLLALATLPLGMTWCPLHRRHGGPQDHSRWVRKILLHRVSIPRLFSL